MARNVSPEVSVLLPVRDAGRGLSGCLDSLAAQTLAAHEVVAVDDGSQDGSGERLIARAARDPRLRVIRTPARGIVAALNLALDEARAPIVARMDADDWAHPRRLAAQLARLRDDPRVDVLGCRVTIGAPGGEADGAGMRAYLEWVNDLVDHDTMARARFVESPIIHPSVAMRIQALRGLGGYRDFEGPEDYDLWLRAFDAGLRFAKLPEVLLEWRDSPARLTRTHARYSARAFVRLKVAALGRGLLGGRPAASAARRLTPRSGSRRLRASSSPPVARWSSSSSRRASLSMRTRRGGAAFFAADARGESPTAAASRTAKTRARRSGARIV